VVTASTGLEDLEARVEKDLDAEAEKNESGKAKHDNAAGAPDETAEPWGGAIAEVNESGDDEQAGERGEGTNVKLNAVAEQARAKGEGDGDGARAASERECEGIEGAAGDEFFGGFGVVFMGCLWVAVEQTPARGGDEKAAADANGVERKTEEGKDEGAEEGGGEQQEEGVDADAAGDARSRVGGPAGGHAEVDRREAERIDDGEQREDDEEELLAEGADFRRHWAQYSGRSLGLMPDLPRASSRGLAPPPSITRSEGPWMNW
jgi:hypothetical protein